MLTEADKSTLKLIAGILLVVFWMGIQYSGWHFSGPLFLAAILQYPAKMLHEPIRSTWRDGWQLLIWIAVMAVVWWLLDRFFTKEEIETMEHSAIAILLFGGAFITSMIYGWYRRQRVMSAAG